MTKRTECPPESVLKELIDGKVDEPRLSELSEHVEDCGTCQERAKTFSPHDTLVASLRTDPEPAKKIADGIPRPLIEKVKEIARSESKPGADTLSVTSDRSAKLTDVDFDFLAPPQQPDEIGRLGAYRILKVLGKGGMGVVFLADDPELDRKVALKAMLPSVAANPAAKQRFLREARTAAKLRSDHVVTIFQVGEDRGVPFLAMELLDGMPLDGVLQSGGQLTLAQILCIGMDVAKGLAAAHEKGLIHRDIKPANLWLDQAHGGRVKILDFGLARAEQDDVHLTQSGAIVGTPAYMAPEQARGEKAVDARVDLFSLGCVLYRLCTGDIPFKGDTTMGVLLSIALNDPVPPVKVNDRIPPALSELIMQLLEKDPAQRPISVRDVIARLREIEQSVAALRDDLQKADSVPSDLASSDLNQAAPPQPGLIAALERAKAEAAPAPNSLSRKRRPVVFALAALLFVGLIALGGAVFYWQSNNGIVRVEINEPNIKVVPPAATGYALRFDGKQRVEIPNLKIDPKVVKEHTVEAWVLIDGKGKEMSARLIGNARFGLICVTEKGVTHLGYALTSDKTGRAVIASGAPKNKFHIAGVFDGKRLTLFIDGKRTNDGAKSQSYEVQAPCYLGMDFTGTMSEIRISKTARYDKDFTPRERFESDTDTLALYHFDEGAGDVLKDSSGNNHHGKIVGAKWVKADGTPIVRPIDPDWLKAVAGMKANEQIEAIKAELLNRNPGFDAKLMSPPRINKGIIEELRVFTDKVKDLSPLQALIGLQRLECGGGIQDGILVDLSPLKDLKLISLYCSSTQVKDLTPLKDMKQLSILFCSRTPVSDLSPLQNLKLTYLDCHDTKVTDLSPLKDMPLKELLCDAEVARRNAAILRSITALQKINGQDAKKFLK